MFVHVDTNGVLLQESLKNIHIIGNEIDLLGLPLDGPEAGVHDLVRGYRGHFDIVIGKMSWLTKLNRKIKINTILTSMNAESLQSIAELVMRYSPSRWSIYQYWAIGPATLVKSMYSVSGERFHECVKPIAEWKHGKRVQIEINPAESRRRTYPIIHHDGNVYVHEEFPGDSFVCIGNIFDCDISYKMAASCSGDRPEAIGRYCL